MNRKILFLIALFLLLFLFLNPMHDGVINIALNKLSSFISISSLSDSNAGVPPNKIVMRRIQFATPGFNTIV